MSQNSLSTTDAQSARTLVGDIQKTMEQVMQGQQQSVRWLIASLAAGGHVLLEDMPGTGKTTLAKSLAQSLSCTFQRVQCTPDLLPSDILGVSIYDQSSQAFSFRQGPIFTHILLVDEINRASPRTQSALFEAMAEGQVSIEGNLHTLEAPFFMVATQNPVEFHGTYPLPEAQMDRFAMRFSLGYVREDQEVAIMRDQASGHPLQSISACANREAILALQKAVSQVAISDELMHYIVQIVSATRTAPGIKLGASPRASLILMKIAQALTLIDGRDFVIPETIHEIAIPVIAHRLVVDPQVRFSGKTTASIVEEILSDITVPA